MKRIENTSPINTITNLLLEKLPPITSDAQTLSQIVNRINKQKKTLKPWRPQKYCMYPASPRIDDYNFNQGLGQVSLQPTIDKLNSFKEAAINAIKTKFQAMGPEGSKDIKLAAGAADLLKQVLEAAKCYSKIVKNVNNLVKLTDEESKSIISDRQNELQLTAEQIKRWAGKKCLCLIEVEDVAEISPLKYDRQKNMDDWITVEDIQTILEGSSENYVALRVNK